MTRILLEKYLDQPRHIEVQVFADRHGNILHIFDRDCSIQRRHQKVIEEAPAPGIEQEMWRAMGEAAVAAARAVGYVGAGTVEFIAQRGSHGAFYFIEMNTRLQVEHAVTEAITGLDLVEWQLRVAAGQHLPLCQHDLSINGHAIEARLYAEDPERQFLPQTGALHRLYLPPPEIARVDTGVREGDVVTSFYDPMIAKIIVFGEDRPAAIGRLQRALSETAVLGVRTNLGFLARVAAHSDFAGAAIDTGFIERHQAALLPAERAVPQEALAAAVINRLMARKTVADATATSSADPFCPWASSGGWRLGCRAEQDVTLRHAGKDNRIAATAMNRGWVLRFDDRQAAVSSETGSDGLYCFTFDGVKKRVHVLDYGSAVAVFIEGGSWQFEEIDRLAAAASEDPAAGKLTAPMPGRVTRLLVEVGAKVRRGEPLMAIEAMKMEHTITAPADGVIESVRFAVGDLVEEGAELIALAAPETEHP